jgi:hypothetical protein
MPIDFNEATDAIFRPVCTPEEFAERLGVARNSLARYRMDQDNPNSRPPPAGWQAHVRAAAEARIAELRALVRAL